MSAQHLTARQAAEYIGCSYDFLLDEVRAGRIRALKFHGYRLERVDLDQYMQDRADAQTEARRKAAKAKQPASARVVKRRALPVLPPIPGRGSVA
ncbi:MAG: helix-turn-helix domain-containing protein [Thermomicrobiales bacterium]|jgi:excisionase family DNA binding protein|nr:MAG: helix-turn-helix domain-containing protein [Thermomicrobiales bacterium]